MILIADSSALIALAACDCLSVLEALYQQVKVPQAVYQEVIKHGKSYTDKLTVYLHGKVSFADYSQYLFLPTRIGMGEQEAMLLYRQFNANVLLVDDLRARKVAVLNHISVIGTLGILLKAKAAGLIPLIAPIINVLEQAGIFYSSQLIQFMLKTAGEEL